MIRKNRKRTGPAVLAVIDANLNRAKEGLRTLEDSFRFTLPDEKTILDQLRSARHSIGKIYESIESRFLPVFGVRMVMGW